MNKQKIIDSIKQSYLIKRVQAEEKAEDFISSLRQNKDFDEMFSTLTKKQIDLLKTEVEEEKAELKAEISALNNKIDAYLKTNNIEKSNLSPKYDCPLCQDTGVYLGKMCVCLKEELNKRITQLTSSQTNFKSFDMCNPAIMNETDIRLRDILKTWCEKYPETNKININILGGSGTGKTFMLECVANELVKRGVAVCYITAFELNEQARLYHIGKSFEFMDSMNADVLLIDDLGTEPVLKNVTKEYLYNLKNIRQVNKRPTLITSNLSLESILDRYDERIFSRLANKSLSINVMLNSQDKRLT